MKVTVELPADLMRRVETFAARHGYSIDRAIVVLLELGLEREKAENSAQSATDSK